jgi:nucleotide-binding universal stress UspA family protein
MGVRPFSHGAGATQTEHMINHSTPTKIVVPVDSVDDREAAVAVACDIARRLDAAIELVTVMDLDMTTAPRDLTTTNELFQVPHRFIKSDSVEKSLAQVTKDDFVLMCVPSSGRTALVETIVGSHSASMLNHSPRPVLVVGPHCSQTLHGTQLAIAVDGTEPGESIVQPAIDLAGALGLIPTLYQVLPEGSPAMVGDVRESSYVAELALSSSRPGCQVQFDVLHDRYVGRALIRLAEDSDVAMLAMSSLGLAPVERLMLPSVAHHVLRHARCPMLLGPRTAPVAPFDHGHGPRVVVGVDGTSADRGALTVAVGEAERRGAMLEIVHAWTPTWYYTEVGAMIPHDDAPVRERAQQILAAAVIEAKHVASELKVTGWLTDRMPIDALLEASVGADIVVVAEHHYNAFERWLEASTTESLVRRSSVPVMVVPEWSEVNTGHLAESQ